MDSRPPMNGSPTNQTHEYSEGTASVEGGGIRLSRGDCHDRAGSLHHPSPSSPRAEPHTPRGDRTGYAREAGTAPGARTQRVEQLATRTVCTRLYPGLRLGDWSGWQ